MTQSTESPLTPAEAEVKAMIARVANRGATIEPSLDQSQGRESNRPRQLRRRYVSLATVVAVAAAVALIALMLVSPSAPPSSITSPKGSGSVSLQMQLVDSTSSPFASVGGGPQTGDLLCVTPSTCYASDDTAPGGLGWEVTNDGGVTWRILAALPQGRLLSDPVACPSATTCVGVAAPTIAGGLAPSEGPQLALTSDGGRSWRLDSLPVPPAESHATIERLSCPTASDCVAFLTNSPATSANFFMTTTDGGSTWTSSTQPAGLTGLWALHCDEDGDCIGLDPRGACRTPMPRASWPSDPAIGVPRGLRQRAPCHSVPGFSSSTVVTRPTASSPSGTGRVPRSTWPEPPMAAKVGSLPPRLRVGHFLLYRSAVPTARTATSRHLTMRKRATSRRRSK